MNTNNDNSSVTPYVTEAKAVLCPFCAEEIQQAAIKCKHCGSQINPEGAPNSDGLIIENPTEEDKVEYEENPSMFRNHPFYFVFCLALCFVGIGFIMFIYWWVRKKSYKLTVSRYKTSLTTGFLSKKISEVFHTDIKNIVVEQSLLQRILNTGTIKVSSSGQDDFEIAIHGMPRPYDIKGIIDLHRTPQKA